MGNRILTSAIISICLVVLTAMTAFALNVNDPAPFFSLRDSNGSLFYLSDHVGSKNKGMSKGIVLNFFASYCKPCREELPVLNALTDELASSGIKVIIIGLNEDFDKIDEMLSDLHVDKPTILSDKFGKVGEKFGVHYLPMTFLIGPDGKVLDILRGEIPNLGAVLKERTSRLIKR